MRRACENSVRCRVLAAVAWLALLSWFVFVFGATWGVAPAAMLFWTPPALALGLLTARWLRRAGRPVPADALALAVGGCAACGAAMCWGLTASAHPDAWWGAPHDAALRLAWIVSFAAPPCVTLVALWAVFRRPGSAARRTLRPRR